MLQEIQVRGRLKNDPIRQGGADFFWNTPIWFREKKETKHYKVVDDLQSLHSIG